MLKLYCDFLKEHENLGHMIEVTRKPKFKCVYFQCENRSARNKRIAPSGTAQLFNPHFTKPVFTKKIPYMQELWKLKFNWKDTLLDSIAQSWVQFTNSLKSSEKMKFESLHFKSLCTTYNCMDLQKLYLFLPSE